MLSQLIDDNKNGSTTGHEPTAKQLMSTKMEELGLVRSLITTPTTPDQNLLFSARKSTQDFDTMTAPLLSERLKEQLLLQAHNLIQDNKTESAIIPLESILKFDPANKDARQLLQSPSLADIPDASTLKERYMLSASQSYGEGLFSRLLCLSANNSNTHIGAIDTYADTVWVARLDEGHFKTTTLPFTSPFTLFSGGESSFWVGGKNANLVQITDMMPEREYHLGNTFTDLLAKQDYQISDGCEHEDTLYLIAGDNFKRYLFACNKDNPHEATCLDATNNCSRVHVHGDHTYLGTNTGRVLQSELGDYQPKPFSRQEVPGIVKGIAGYGEFLFVVVGDSLIKYDKNGRIVFIAKSSQATGEKGSDLSFLDTAMTPAGKPQLLAVDKGMGAIRRFDI